MKPAVVILLCLLGAALLCGAVFLSVFAVRRYTDRKLERYQSDLMDRHYHEVENMYRQMRGWRHDYKNHIAAMKIHLQNGELALLQNYLDELNRDLAAVDTLVKTGNIMVDAILNSKLSLARANDIRIDDATAHVPPEIPVSDTDICVIIGNLLDNAIEACCRMEQPEQRFIRVYIGRQKGQLYISVTNSTGGVLRREGKTYLSSKDSGHGFGLWRIDRICEKYGGFVNRQDETDVFATEILLPL